ncbi:MAG: chemotaxis protein CheA [Treponema bryantii]|nr:chemotaxis protein CheA [Treponema bryantii]
MSDYLDPNNEELLKDFFAEAEQQVEQLESNILVIESDPSNRDAIDEIFRAAHTLKGGSATVEMMELSHFTHSVEDVLDEIRSDKIKIDEDVVDLLLTSIDVIKAMLEERQNGSVYEENIDVILNKLNSYLNKTEKPAPSAKKAPVVSEPKPVVPEPVIIAQPVQTSSSGLNYPNLSEDEFAELKSACEPNQKLWCVGVKFDEENPMNSVGGIQVFAALKTLANVLKTVPDFDALYEDQFYENVFYYIATQATADEIEDVAFLSDVTIVTDAKELTEESISANIVTEIPVQQPVVTEVKEVATPKVESVEETINNQIIQNENASSEEKVVKKTEQKKESANHSQNSVLRVDAKRVDNLLNLVSEAVIVKATFNQLALQFTNNASSFQNSEIEFKDKLHSLFDKLPSYLERMQEGVSANEIKKEILKEYGSLSSIFDAYESEQKNILSKFRSNTQNLGTISGELQEGVMKIRMVPINQIFSRFPRVVRDLQKDLNKKINLVIEGEDTELDKSVVEDLLDPIMHCVRNSVDHGIELPSERVAAGKPETGTILLRAFNEGNMIVIEIKDDGKGIDVEKVRAKAVERGLIHPSKNINDQEAFQLIMQPGFSTAEKISNISGRGVGLDVVKTMITNLKGNISVSSTKGNGTTFTIKIPLTLAIIQGLLVRVGKEIYSIPISNVIESQCIKMDEINFLDNYEIMNLRSEVISVLRLSRLFNIKDSVQSDECYIVIVGTQEKKIGVMVDSLIGEEDVVIKPLRDQFTNSPGIAGASILGDGSVSLIIDVSQLLELGVKQELLSKHKEQQL